MALLFENETHLVIGACMQVHQKLGSGFLESVYQEGLEKEFQKQQIPFIRHQRLHIMFDGRPLEKFFIADFVATIRLSSKLKQLDLFIPTIQNK